MYPENYVVRTKLIPPYPPKRTLVRPRLTQRLLEAADYRLTMVQAGAGYGKSTALAALTAVAPHLVWYHLDDGDVDPLRLLLHLYHGFAAALPGFSTTPLTLLEAWDRGSAPLPWTTAVDMLVNTLADCRQEAIFLVLDDVHLLEASGDPLRILDRLIGRAPANLHIILATRYPLKLPTTLTWQVRGELLEINQAEMAFTPAEIQTLFQEQYRLPLTNEQVNQLAAKSEGWAIALQLVWQRWQSDTHTTLNDALEQLSGSSSDLFSFLVQEVLAQQALDIQAFLRETAVLREMDTAACNFLRQAQDSEQILRYLQENSLFVVSMGEGVLRYHHLLRELLQNQLEPYTAQTLHRRAAAYYRQQGDEEKTIHHLLAAGDFEQTAVILDESGRRLVRSGRLNLLSGWMAGLPPEVLETHPTLLVCLGDIARLHSRFDEALGWYQQAETRARTQGSLREVGQALRGQARVYLDTVNPSQAEQLLQEAMRISDGLEDRESRARLRELLAENMLNLGHLEEAETYRQQARALRQEGPAEAELSVRVLLRTGRLAEARQLLEDRVHQEQQEPVLRPRAHRETPLLLALVLAFEGEREHAHAFAMQGTQRGQMFQSPFITAVGYMRQGHAWLLQKDEQGYEEAYRCFRQCIALSDRLMVPRLKVESFWGICQVHGFRGHLAEAAQAAEQGIAIARSAGDEWIEAFIHLSLGAGYVLADEIPQASGELAQALAAFRECNDTHGEALALLWQCLIWQDQGEMDLLRSGLAALLRLARTYGYDYLFTRRTLVGPPDPRALVPLLLTARDEDVEATYARRLLALLGLSALKLHPGYQLRVQTLGQFMVWRGAELVAPREWQRKTARQLLQLLLSRRREVLDRDQIVDLLWPELDPENGRRNFKIAFNALCQALEPDRPPRAPSAFVLRDGTLYGLRPEADIWLDVEAFETAVDEGDCLQTDNAPQAMQAYRRALALHQGEFLAEARYEEWCSEERERLITLYLRAADRLAQLLAEAALWEEALHVCQVILTQDNCWEQAYRLMMQAYAELGNRAQALRTYHRCVDYLQKELGVAPTAVTTDLYQQILSA
ncbi:MAG: transcriptional regulator [Ardenticatenaceae bacterium]|nr:transcriptional regulator [Ardenticatenaceae bacterium]